MLLYIQKGALKKKCRILRAICPKGLMSMEDGQWVLPETAVPPVFGKEKGRCNKASTIMLRHGTGFLFKKCPSINGLFGVSWARLPAQSLRYAQRIILGGKRACETPISNIYLRLFFSHALILNKKPPLWMDTKSGGSCRAGQSPLAGNLPRNAKGRHLPSLATIFILNTYLP